MTVPVMILTLLVATIGSLSFAESPRPVIMKEDRSIWSKIFRVPTISSGPITAMAVFSGPSFMMIAYDNR